MPKYFDTFPIAQYNNEYCRKLTSRAAMTRAASSNASTFYPYQIHQNERPDTLATLYYDDPSLEWLLFFTNNIIDPYYDWYLSEEQFNGFIASKYGSLAAAQQKTRHFEVSWLNDSSRKTVAEYNLLSSVYPTNLKQYWAPQVDEYDVVVGYVRKQLDTKVSTNKVLQLNVDNVTGYQQGEIVYQISGSAVSASAEIDVVGVGYLIVKHVYGSFSIANLIGQDSGASHTLTSSSVLKQNIPTAEEAYWTGVSFYDYEAMLNEQRKAIRVIDRAFTDNARNSLKAAMGT
jgi:hypothetical protein